MLKDKITVLISSSPIESHPSTAIIEETVSSVRYHLPDSRIIVMLDGVREEQSDYANRYLVYLNSLVGLAMFKMGNVALMPFMEFHHQAAMTMRALEQVRTPLILFMEHDTPLVEKPIEWECLDAAIDLGTTNHIRLHYDEQIHPEHQHLMRGKLSENFIKCVQWHQRPHLAKASWYREVLGRVFTEKSRTFIEDRVYTFVENAPWEDYRLTIYDPEGTGQNMKRSRDLNGRGSDPKYSMEF